jgi:hypothetical protein
MSETVITWKQDPIEGDPFYPEIHPLPPEPSHMHDAEADLAPSVNRYLVTMGFVVEAVDPIHAQILVLESNNIIPTSCSAEVIEEDIE